MRSRRQIIGMCGAVLVRRLRSGRRAERVRAAGARPRSCGWSPPSPSSRTSRRTSPATAATVESITKPGAEIHDYQPTPLDVVKAQSADLVLWNGLNLERWFERFFENVKTVPSAVRDRGHRADGHQRGALYRQAQSRMPGCRPANALIYVENIRKALAEADPANAETYATQRRRLCRADQGGRRAAARAARARCRRTSAGSSPARAPSAIWPATTAGARPISGRSTPTSRARRSRCAG